jgi:formyltetrahydrofolate synthetase
VYKSESVELVAAGCANLQHHIRNAAKYGVRVVVAINKFVTDTDAEVRSSCPVEKEEREEDGWIWINGGTTPTG